MIQVELAEIRTIGLHLNRKATISMSAKVENATYVGNGVYTFSEAASLTRLKSQRVREWFRGRPSERRRRPVFQGDYAPVDGDYAISFLDLIDLFVAGQLRDHGVSLQTVRRVYCQLERSLRTKHPFARQELLTDGNEVFTRGLDSKGREEIVHVLSSQKVFPRVILPFLKAIDYSRATRLALRWRIAQMVVVDPAVCFGKPVIEGIAIPTAILSAAYHANGKDAELVADWYDVHSSHVIAAAKFEASIGA